MPLGQLASIADDLRAIPREARRDATARIRVAAAPVLADARSRAAWSSRIPPAMRIRALYGKRPGVALVVSTGRAPHARPYEGLSGLVFRAPLFGDREHWFAHRARPYALPAVRAHAAEVGAAVAETVTDAARRHGFH